MTTRPFVPSDLPTYRCKFIPCMLLTLQSCILFEAIDGAELPLCILVNSSSLRYKPIDRLYFVAQNPLRNTIMIPINRRTFIMAAAVAVTPTLTHGQTPNSKRTETGILVKADQDRFMRRKSVLGGFPIDSKVATQDTDGGLFIIENLNEKKGDLRVTSIMSRKSGFTPSKVSIFWRLVKSDSIWVQAIPSLLRERYPMPGHLRERTTEDS